MARSISKAPNTRAWSLCREYWRLEFSDVGARSAFAANELQAFCGASGVRVMPISGTRQMPSTPNVSMEPTPILSVERWTFSVER